MRVGAAVGIITTILIETCILIYTEEPSQMRLLSCAYINAHSRVYAHLWVNDWVICAHKRNASLPTALGSYTVVNWHFSSRCQYKYT